MSLNRFLAVVAALCVLAAPAVALAATATTQTANGGTTATAAEARQAVHHRAYLRNVRLARAYARRTGRHLPARYARVAQYRQLEELRRSNARLRHRLNRLHAQRRVARAAIASVGRSRLAAIANCESHGNPRAIG